MSASHAIRPTLYYSGIKNTTCRSVVMKLSHFGLILFRVISVKYQKKDDLQLFFSKLNIMKEIMCSSKIYVQSPELSLTYSNQCTSFAKRSI